MFSQLRDLLRNWCLIPPLLLAAPPLWSVDQPLNDLSLAQLYPPDKLRAVLIAREQWRPYPTFTNRPAWLALPAEARAAILQDAEEALAQPLPALPATLYLEFAREGNRSRFEAQHKARRQRLHQLVLAECIQAQGRFLDSAANLLWAICEESSWCYPAHIAAQRAGRGLPDVTEPIIDLFSAETAVSIAWAVYLLDTQWDKVSPLIRPRITRETDQRILQPFLARDNFGWMAFGPVTPANRPNNWNPWINASVLTAALLSEPDPDRRVQIAHKVLRSLDRFLLAHPPDGSCDEGPGYWGHAGGSLFDSLDLLHLASAGQIDLFDQPLVREIGRFIYRAHICQDFFVPVGDCGARLDLARELVHRYGQRIQDPNLRALGAAEASAQSVLDSAGDRFFGRLLPALFNLAGVLESRPANAPLLRDVWLGSEDLQLLAARDQAGVCRGFYLAAWGGHNGQSHNHNDVGNFILFDNGQPVLVDVGVTTYTAQTFSSRRYDIWVMQSAYHNLPTINGQMQQAGRRAAARQVRHQATDQFAQLDLDLGNAYPAAAGVDSWQRTLRLNRGQNLILTDSFQLRQSSGPTFLSLMTPRSATVSAPGHVVLAGPDPGSSASTAIHLTFDATKLTPEIEPITLEDERLAAVWGTRLYRILLRAPPNTTRDTWTLTFARTL